MQKVSAKIYEFGEFRLDENEKILFRGDKEMVEITPKALEILFALVENAGRIVAKEEIFERVWAGSFVEEANLSHHIFRLRKALGEDAGQKFIETVPKRGYRFVAEVREVENDSVNKAENESANKNGDGNKKPRAGLALALIVSACALLGFGYWFYGKNSSDNEQISSIAVMPFANETGSADVEYLSDGMTETLIRNLSQLPELSIKARSSAFRYKGRDASPRQIGSELNVQAVLNGRVVQRGDELTLYLSLVDTRTENQIWGEQYNRKFSNLIALQTEIAEDVSNKLRLKLSGANRERLAKKQTNDPEAYRLYLKGRYHWNKRTIADIRKSLDYFNQAIEKDPAYALAYAGLADAYALIPGYSPLDSPHDYLPKARTAALKALEIDETLAEAHTTLAAIKNDYDWKFAEAEKDFRRAIELNPNYATAHNWYAENLLTQGRYEEALREIKIAQEIDPLSLIINSMHGNIYRILRRYDAAIEQLKKTIEMDPNFPRAHLFLAEAYENKGLYDEAATEFERHAVLLGTPADEAARDWTAVKEAYKTEGAKGFKRKQLEIYERGRAQKLKIAPPLVVIAGVYAQIGDNEKALEYLEKGFEQRDSTMVRLRMPEYDPLRADPRFKDLLRRIGME